MQPLFITTLDSLTSSDEDSDVIEIGSGPTCINGAGVSEFGSCRSEIRMNGIDRVDAVEFVSRNVDMNNDTGNDDIVIESVIDKRNLNRHTVDGTVGGKICKRSYGMPSGTPPTEDEGFLEGVDGSNSTPNGECHPHGSDLVSASEESASVHTEADDESVFQSPSLAVEVRLGEVISPHEWLAPPSSSSDSRVLPSNCDSCSSNSGDEVAAVQIALASSPSPCETKLDSTPPWEIVSAKPVSAESATINGDILIVDEDRRCENQAINGRVNDLPGVHKEDNVVARQSLTNCRIISTKLISSDLPAVHSEVDRKSQHNNSSASSDNASRAEVTSIDAGGSTNRQFSTVSDIVSADQNGLGDCCSPTPGSGGCETGRCGANPDFVASDRVVRVENANCQLPTLVTEINEIDWLHQHSGCRLQTSPNKDGETDLRHRAPKAAGKGNVEPDRHATRCHLSTVHKRHMLVDCDVSTPQNVWSSIVNRNMLTSGGGSLTHRAAYSMSYTANEVLYLFVHLFRWQI